jgi:hypothetical protein
VLGRLYCGVLGRLYCGEFGRLSCGVLGRLYCGVLGRLYCGALYPPPPGRLYDGELDCGALRSRTMGGFTWMRPLELGAANCDRGAAPALGDPKR